MAKHWQSINKQNRCFSLISPRSRSFGCTTGIAFEDRLTCHEADRGRLHPHKSLVCTVVGKDQEPSTNGAHLRFHSVHRLTWCMCSPEALASARGPPDRLSSKTVSPPPSSAAPSRYKMKVWLVRCPVRQSRLNRESLKLAHPARSSAYLSLHPTHCHVSSPA